MLVIVGISVFFLIGIVIAMIYFVVRYSRKNNPVATQIEGNMLLEVVWIVIPLLIVLGMFWLGWKDFYVLREKTDAALTVQVKGQMWKWTFTYPNGKESDTLYIPVGKVTKLEMKSVDVNHAFFIPAFRLKEDVIASRTTYMMLTPDKIGDFDIACAEYCGLNHAYMYTKLRVVSSDDYALWVATTKSDSTSTAKESTSEIIKPISSNDYISKIQNHKDFSMLVKFACVSCHTTDGSNKIGPSFAKLSEGKSKVVTNGKERTTVVDKNYLRSSVLEPDTDIVAGFKPYTMPSMRGRISEEDLNTLISLLLVQ